MDIITLINAYGVNLIIAGILSVDYLGIFLRSALYLGVYDTFVQSTDFVVMPSSGDLDKKGLLVIIIKNLILGILISVFLSFLENLFYQLFMLKNMTDIYIYYPIYAFLDVPR